MDLRGFHSITLGCKLNQFDTAVIEGALFRRGYRPQPDPASAAVVVVNTCTVTHKADAEARRLIRSMRRANPGCTLVVTGCYAEHAAGEIRRIDGVDLVFGNSDKRRIEDILDEAGLGVGGDRGCDASTDPPPLHFGERSRAFLKIQEGCRLTCSYCIIPAVRGPSRSIAPEKVLRAADSLLQTGFRELVLTGVNTGDYGRDLEPPSSLADLLRRLLAACGPNRVRLNSLEPRTVTDEIVDLMAADPRLVPHLQVPLQSGSDRLLRHMRRNYRTRDYLERLCRLRESVPDVGLGADVLVGFPGEDEASFRETQEFIEASPLNYLHVFSWSPRPGTPASDLPDRVPGPVVRERSNRLRRLADHLSLRFRRGFEGRLLDALVLCERRTDLAVRALTGNFIEVLLPAGTGRRGDLVQARIERALPGETRAVPAGVPVWARSGP